jgi:hypothetical protein
MTRDKVQTAIDEGIPFELRMEDGRSYRVTSRYQVGLGKTVVTVIDQQDLPHVLPLLTMTGISYLPAKVSRTKKQ